jgi:hypothetical protein
MADLDELMTDEAVKWSVDPDEAQSRYDRNALRAELREPLRALRESHEALVEAAKVAMKLNAEMLVHAYEMEPERIGHVMPDLVAVMDGLDAALAKAEALHG